MHRSLAAPAAASWGSLPRAATMLRCCNTATHAREEAIEPPQSGAGLHRHPTYDETHIICEGHYEFQLGERMLALHPGDMVFAPRGTAHAIKCIGPQTGRELLISSPGGIFDAFIAEV